MLIYECKRHICFREKYHHLPLLLSPSFSYEVLREIEGRMFVGFGREEKKGQSDPEIDQSAVSRGDRKKKRKKREEGSLGGLGGLGGRRRKWEGLKETGWIIHHHCHHFLHH